ncbi:hypothetical protein TNCV_4162791 [Trichonephila clavipes]|nr:hypothetical protein TNCV_4162791 [Trichonephila clavipes]
MTCLPWLETLTTGLPQPQGSPRSEPESVLSDNMSVVLPDNVSVVLSENQSVVFSGNSDSMVNDMVDCADDYSVAESDFVCPDCLKIFTNKYTLKRHENKLHPNNIALINSLKMIDY